MKRTHTKYAKKSTHTCPKNSIGRKTRVCKFIAAEAGRLMLLGSTVLASQVHAQTQAQTQIQTQEPPTVVEEIVVSGTRVVRDGYQAPTPTTVMSREEIDNFSPANVADVMIHMPGFANNSTPQNSRRSVSAGGAGTNSLNLRGLGANRTLVLLDGQRVVPAQPTGQVDINPFPQQLIERVEVVTGGASAAYGSDAVSGVVNFILDRDFVGTKLDVQTGFTEKGDNEQLKVAYSTGLQFANGRGHFLFSTEYSEVDGIDSCDRDWCREGWNLINNPAYRAGSGLPERLILAQVAPSNMAPGGLITSGPLRGTAFGPGGTPYNFNYGSLNNGSFMQGGDWQANDAHQYTSLNPAAERKNLFARVSYDLNDNIEAFAQLSYGANSSLTSSGVMFNPANITVRADNAFIPPSVKAQMQQSGLNTLQIGTYNRDIGSTQSDNEVELDRYVVGLDGNFVAFDQDWTWDLYYQYGETTNTKSFYDRIRTPYLNAIDSVFHPVSGAIVCRSTLTNPANGCVPWNVFGTDVNTPEARAYVADWSYARETNKQVVVAASIAGTAFNIPAGPVSLATGIEHRKESGGGVEGAINAANQSWLGNQAPTFGSYDVTEGFVETVVPVSSSFLPTEVNAAVRVTDYSTSGTVETWKLGATVALHSDLTLRMTRSRDIRAPNRRELFAAGVYTGSSVLDPFQNNILADVQSLLSGNTGLLPETADSTGVGLVYQSSIINGFSAAVDYYNIEINGAIGSVGRQEVIDRCFRGEQAFCDAIERNAAGNIVVVNIKPTNFVSQLVRGVDLEASYVFDLNNVPGSFRIRALATHYLKDYQDTGSAPPTDNVGSNAGGPPDWRYNVSAMYSVQNFRLSLTGRGLSSGVYDTSNIQCLSACPNSSSFSRTISDNKLDSALYFDLSINYMLPQFFGAETEAYLVVQNLLDKDPAVFARGPGGNPSDPPSNPTFYDILGREFRLGMRIRF